MEERTFNTPDQLKKELELGLAYVPDGGYVCFYDELFDNPFRCGDRPMGEDEFALCDGNTIWRPLAASDEVA